MEMTANFLKEDGTAFGNKGVLMSLLKQKGLENKYDPEETKDGWIGVLKKEAVVAEKPKLIKCRVYRSNVDPDNRDMPISVTFNSISNKRTFWPA